MPRSWKFVYSSGCPSSENRQKASDPAVCEPTFIELPKNRSAVLSPVVQTGHDYTPSDFPPSLLFSDNMHCRRYFAEAFFVNDVASLSDGQLGEMPETKALLLIRDIYHEEKKLKGMSAEDRTNHPVLQYRKSQLAICRYRVWS